MGTKICKKCGIEKDLSQFRKSGKYYRPECKECASIYNIKYQKKYRETHKEKMKEYKKEYNKTYIRPQQSIERHKEKHKIWVQNHKEYRKEYNKKYREQHREQIRENDKKWKKNNIEKVREYQRKDALKRKQDPLKKLELQLRNMINSSFKRKGQIKSKKLELICGINSKELVNYLLNTFKENYGYEWNKIEKVHIDHIIPLKTAKTIEDVYRLCHYSNLQLLKPKDNFQKGAKEDWVLQSQ